MNGFWGLEGPGVGSASCGGKVGSVKLFMSGINGGGTAGGAVGSDTLVAVASTGKSLGGTRFSGIVNTGGSAEDDGSKCGSVTGSTG